MTCLEGIYLERNRYKPHEFCGKHIDALRILGISVKLEQPSGDLVILEDTSEEDH